MDIVLTTRERSELPIANASLGVGRGQSTNGPHGRSRDSTIDSIKLFFFRERCVRQTWGENRPGTSRRRCGQHPPEPSQSFATQKYCVHHV